LDPLFSLSIVGLWILFILILAIVTRKKLPSQKELSRKIIHIGTGPIIPIAWWLQIPSNWAIPISSIVTVGLLINKKLNIIPAMEDIKRASYGTIAYGLSITIMLICFWSDYPEAVTAGILVMAFGDGLAGLLGKNFKSRQWKVLGQTKSLIGTITMGCISLLSLILLNLMIGSPLHLIHLVSISILAVLLEQISYYGIDNFTVPIAISSAWYLLIRL